MKKIKSVNLKRVQNGLGIDLHFDDLEDLAEQRGIYRIDPLDAFWTDKVKKYIDKKKQTADQRIYLLSCQVFMKSHFPVRLPTCRSRVSQHRSLRHLPTLTTDFGLVCYHTTDLNLKEHIGVSGDHGFISFNECLDIFDIDKLLPPTGKFNHGNISSPDSFSHSPHS